MSSGGREVVVTYCPLCRTGLVFDRRLEDGALLTFGNTGSLYESAMVMYDHQTDSKWWQAAGEAITGTAHRHPAHIASRHHVHVAGLGGYLATDAGAVAQHRPPAGLRSGCLRGVFRRRFGTGVSDLIFGRSAAAQRTSTRRRNFGGAGGLLADRP